MALIDVLILLVVAVLFFGIGWFVNASAGKKNLTTARKKAELILQDAAAEGENQKKEKLLEASEEIYQQKQKLEEEFRSKKNSLKAYENDLNNKENDLDRKADLISKKERELFLKERELKNQENNLNIRQSKLEESIEEANKKLETISGLSRDEAKQMLMDNLLDEAKRDITHNMYQMVQEAHDSAKQQAQRIITTSIEQIASNHTIESTVTTVKLPSDDMKGRIIGKEGRNIRAFEVVTGVDVIVDDTPQAVLLSAFDPARREIARITMERLVSDGRIHPGRIEETYEKVLQEMDDHYEEVGEQTLHELGIHGLNPEIVQTLGKLKYRTSYGQNILEHCQEVAEIAGKIAVELGLDSYMAKRAGMMHKIGMAIEKASESDYSKVGHEFLKKHGEATPVLNAVLAFTNHAEANTPIAVVVRIAEEISRSRPGARRDVIENYVKRLSNLEDIADSFEGVKSAYAIQAGKEIRIIIDHDKADDAQSHMLSSEIAKKIRSNVDHAGQIKVHVIREFRAIDYA